MQISGDFLRCQQQQSKQNALTYVHPADSVISRSEARFLCGSWVFCCAMLCISAAYAVAQCLSVRLAVRHVRVFIVSKQINKSSKLFNWLVTTPVWFSRTSGNIPTGSPLT